MVQAATPVYFMVTATATAEAAEAAADDEGQPAESAATSHDAAPVPALEMARAKSAAQPVGKTHSIALNTEVRGTLSARSSM